MGLSVKVGSRVLSYISETSSKQPLIIRSRANHGLMAPSKHSKLVCFYCNKRSDVRYDGLITQWECVKCDSVNYLDENGDITDPPVAVPYDTLPAPLPVQYATRSESPNFVDSNNVFCSTCIKNQHLYTSSLREYEFDVEELFSKNVYDYVQAEKEIAKFKNGLEARYPQVCEDCEPRVLERLKTAKRTAQTDHIGRLLKKTKERRNTAQHGIVSIRTFEKIGKWSCIIGIFGQLLWHISVLFIIAEHNYSTKVVNSTILSSFITLHSTIISTLTSILGPAHSLSLTIPYLSPLISGLTLKSLAKYSLIATLPSLLWSPKFREAANGFLTHVNGYGEYYRLQSILFSLRVFFYLLMGTKLFSDPFAPIMAGAHLVMPCFVLLIAFKMKHSVKVDIGPLFAIPEKIKFVGPPTGSPIEKENSIERARKLISSGRPLPEPKIVGSSHSQHGNSFDQHSISKQGEFRYRSTGGSFNQPDLSRKPAPYDQQEPYSSLSSSLNLPRKTTPPYTLTSETEQNHYSITRETPAYPHEIFDENPTEEMEWSPTRPKSSYRAFASPAEKRAAETHGLFGSLRAEEQSQSQQPQFNQIPVAERPSNFWFKVPPAPIAPAHRIRNPPNQPKLRVASIDAKQNFFDNVTRHSGVDNSSNDISPSDLFSQQKFFPAQAASAEGEDLADLFGGFSLSKPNNDSQTPNQTWINFVVTTSLALVIVGCAYFFWLGQ